MYQIINRKRPDSAIKANKLGFVISKQHVSLSNTLAAFHFSNKSLLFSTSISQYGLDIFKYL